MPPFSINLPVAPPVWLLLEMRRVRLEKKELVDSLGFCGTYGCSSCASPFCVLGGETPCVLSLAVTGDAPAFVPLIWVLEVCGGVADGAGCCWPWGEDENLELIFEIHELRRCLSEPDRLRMLGLLVCVLEGVVEEVDVV